MLRRWIPALILLAAVCAAMPASAEGVLVLKVDAMSPLAAQLASSDRILEVSQQSVPSPEEVEKLFAAARQSGNDSVLLLVNSMSGLRFMPVSSVTLDGVTFLREPAKSPGQ